MRDDLARKYDLRIPRYTSYPTAPHFSDAVNAETYGEWLAGLDPKTVLSLYMHIPFCDSMCWFCGCYTKIVKRHDPVMNYLETAIDEVGVVADRLPGRFAARHLHFGGGSPTMLTPDEFARAIGRVRERFDLIANAEIAVEIDPRTTTEDYIKGLAAAGVNRASIGVQDFDDQVQQAINRIQPFDVTARVVEWLYRHGIDRVNMDLMYGLPHQTVARVEAMVDQAATLRPVRVALFGYAHVPWMKTHQKMINEADLPDTEERWRQYEAASARLIAHGYKAVGLDHFARPDDELAAALGAGQLHRNFQGYTTDTAAVLLGFGASAIGSLPKGYVQNLLPLEDYAKAIQAGRLATAKGLAYRGDDRLRGEIIERLMCDLRVDVAEVAARHGANFADFADAMGKLESLVADGVITVEGARIDVTADGRPLVRLVAAAFDRYLDVGQKRHSKAV